MRGEQLETGDDAQQRRQSLQDFDRLASPRLSMTTFGTMRPKLIARMIVIAVIPSAIVAARSSRVVFELLVSKTRPLAILKRKTPGIIDTTEAKPMAANGMCQRRATGVRISPTTRQATKTPVAAPKPTASVHHLTAWASIPTAIGQPSICNGVEKKILYAATAT